MKELIVIFLSTRKYYLSFFECGNYGVMWFFFFILFLGQFLLIISTNTGGNVRAAYFRTRPPPKCH